MTSPTPATRRSSLASRLASPRTGGLLVLTAVIAVAPLFFHSNYHYHVANMIGFAAVVAVGLNLLIGYGGQISLGHAGFLGLGAYFSAIATTTYGWPPLLALVIAAAGVAVLAFLVAWPVLKLKGHYLAMATLGLGMIIYIVLRTESDLTGGPDGMPVAAFQVFGFKLVKKYHWYWAIGGLLVFFTWLALNLIDSPVGRALRAVHGSEIAAQVVGVDTNRYKVLVFVVSAVFASVVGSLSAHYVRFLSPSEAGFAHSVELVIMVVLGGMASTYGAIVGAAILTVLPQLLAGLSRLYVGLFGEPTTSVGRWLVDHLDDTQHLVFGLILMLVMIFLPKGLVPSLSALVRRRNGS